MQPGAGGASVYAACWVGLVRQACAASRNAVIVSSTLYARSEQGGRKAAAAAEADEPELVLQTDFAAMGIDLDEARPGPARPRGCHTQARQGSRLARLQLGQRDPHCRHLGERPPSKDVNPKDMSNAFPVLDENRPKKAQQELKPFNNVCMKYHKLWFEKE